MNFTSPQEAVLYEVYCLEVCIYLRRTIAPNVPLAWVKSQPSVYGAFKSGQSAAHLVNDTIKGAKVLFECTKGA